jgi:hypothetical protein
MNGQTEDWLGQCIDTWSIALRNCVIDRRAPGSMFFIF